MCRAVHRSGLCLTQNRPDGIGFWKISPTANRQSKQFGLGQTSTGGGRVGQRLGFEKMGRKRWENSRKRWENLRSSENLIEIYEISPDSAVISSDLMRFHQIRWKSRLIYMKYRLNLGFLAEIWVFLVRFWNFSCWNLGFSSESRVFARIWVFLRSVRVFRVLGDRNRNRPAGVGF